jgi:uncharacterized membrane protein SpoIIM required for sporulation
MRWRRTKKYVGQEWANADARRAGGLFVLVVLAGLHPFFVLVAIAYAVALAIWFGARLVRRRRLERRTDRTSEFWVDRVRPPD